MKLIKNNKKKNYFLKFFFQEAWKLIIQLREQIIQQIKIQDKLRNDVHHLQYNHKIDIHEREQIEELLNRDLTVAKDEIRKRINLF